MKLWKMSILALAFIVSLVGCTPSKSPVSDEDATDEIGDVTDETETNAVGDDTPVDGIVYQLKINPEFEIKTNGDLVVTEVIAKNEDAEAVLAVVDVVGQNVTEAFHQLTDEAKNQGFMTEQKGNTVDITILEKNDEQFLTCTVCGGGGMVVCGNCHSTGIACMCQRCHGSGTEFDLESGGGKWDCWLCHGTGVCPECGGSGKIVVTNGEDGGIVYIAPGVPEMGTCSICWGTGGCDNCHGSSTQNEESDGTCEGCKGTGYLHCNDDLNGYNWCPCCWGSGVEGTGDPDYRSYYTPAEKYDADQWMAILKK